MITKETNFGNFKIEISKEQEEEFFIEIWRSQSSNMRDGCSVFIFDPWYDSEIFQCDMVSDYLWIRTKSKFGIGSISFIPYGSNPEDKDFAVIHEYSKRFRPVIGVFVYPNTPQRVESTKRHILSLKNSRVPIYLCSNMECPEEITALCDGFIYTGPNKLCTVPDEIEDKIRFLEENIKYPITIFPENIRFYQSHSFINGDGTYLWSAVKCIRDSIKELNSLGFTHLMVSEGEFELEKEDSKLPAEIMLEMFSKNVVLDFFYTEGSFYLQAYLWFIELDYGAKVFSEISEREKHFPREGENSILSAYLMCEIYYLHKIASYDTERNITVRTSQRNKDIIEKKYWYTRRTEVIYYPEEAFKNIELGTDENLSFPLYFKNTRKVFPSIASENARKNNHLGPRSFDLDVRKEIGGDKWKIVVINQEISLNLSFRFLLYNDVNVVYEWNIKECKPNIYYFDIINDSNIEVTECHYFAYSDQSDIPFFTGKFEYKK